MISLFSGDFDLLQTFFDSVLRRHSTPEKDLYLAENSRGENIFDFVKFAQTIPKVVKTDLLNFLSRYGIRPKKKSKTKIHKPIYGFYPYEEPPSDWADMAKFSGLHGRPARGPDTGDWISKNNRKPRTILCDFEPSTMWRYNQSNDISQTPSLNAPLTKEKEENRSKVVNNRNVPKKVMLESMKNMKEQANKFHQSKKWPEAVAKYFEAINQWSDDVGERDLAILYCNRAASYISMDMYAEAEKDAEKSMQLDRTYKRVNESLPFLRVMTTVISITLNISHNYFLQYFADD